MPAHSKRTPEVEARILAALTAGTPLAVVCREEGMPDATTWNRWCREDEALGIAHAHARDEGFDAIAADCLQIAEDGSHDYKHKKRSNGEEYEEFDAEHVQRSKLRIETRLKLLAKWDPRRYGDKVALTGGSPDDAPIRTESKLDVGGLTDEQLRVLASIRVEK